jgi:MFS family permease
MTTAYRNGYKLSVSCYLRGHKRTRDIRFLVPDPFCHGSFSSSRALPSAQDALGFSDADRQWIVTTYALALDGLLLFASRVAELVGRKRTLVTGPAGFAIGGAAQSFGGPCYRPRA